MADTVKVESIRAHTYDGVDRPEGMIYDVHPDYLETLEALGMARRVVEAPAETAKKKK